MGAARIDTIVVSDYQQRRINGFINSSRGFGPADDTFRDLASVYESDFGVCRVILCQSVPADSVLLLDSTRIDVLPWPGGASATGPWPPAGTTRPAR